MDNIKFDAMSPSMTLLLFLIIGLILFILIIEPKLSRRKLKNNNEHGSSKFADIKEIKENFDKEELNNINVSGFPVWYEKEKGKFKNVYYDNKARFTSYIKLFGFYTPEFVLCHRLSGHRKSFCLLPRAPTPSPAYPTCVVSGTNRLLVSCSNQRIG